MPQTDTTISRTFEKLLIKLNIPYEKEFAYGHFAFDFKIYNYLIEIQGDYWHCNPKIDRFKDYWKKSKRLFDNKGRDAAKKKEVLTLNEYEFLEFWESEINNDIKKIELCLRKLFL
jgi:hypothetical protein